MRAFLIHKSDLHQVTSQKHGNNSSLFQLLKIYTEQMRCRQDESRPGLLIVWLSALVCRPASWWRCFPGGKLCPAFPPTLHTKAGHTCDFQHAGGPLGFAGCQAAVSRGAARPFSLPSSRPYGARGSSGRAVSHTRLRVSACTRVCVICTACRLLGVFFFFPLQKAAKSARWCLWTWQWGRIRFCRHLHFPANQEHFY